jgi:hypothetical protein
MKTVLAFILSWTVPVKARVSILFVSALISLSGCSQHYYFNASQNVNAFKEKGDIYVSAGVDHNQGGFSAGYAFTDNIGVIASFRGFNPEAKDSTTITFDSDGAHSTGFMDYRSFMAEPELVLTKGIDLKGKPGARLSGSVSLGLAFAGVAQNPGVYSLNMNRLALQPALCYTTDYFDIGLSARFSRLNYNLTLHQMTADTDLGDVGRQPYRFFEPAVTVGGGYKVIKFRLQYLLARNQTDASLKYLSQSVYLSINFTVNSRKPSE